MGVFDKVKDPIFLKKDSKGEKQIMKLKDLISKIQ